MEKAVWVKPNIRKKAGGYEARMTIQGIPYSAFGSTETEAAERLVEKARAFLPLDAHTLKSWIETAYIPTLATRTPKTREKAWWAIKHLGRLGDQPLASLDRHKFQTLVNVKARTHSPATVATMSAVWSAALNLAEADGHIPNNPLRHVRLPVNRPAQKQTLTGPELLALINASRGRSGFPLVVLGGLLGLRLGEIQRLEASHFHDGKLIVPGTKSAAAARELPLHPWIHAELANLPIPLLPPHQTACRTALNRNSKRAGIDRHINPHLLRHTFATLLQWLGCPLDIRSRLLGHSMKHVTQRYSHAEWQAWEDWTSKLVSHVYGDLGKPLGMPAENAPDSARNA